MKPPLTTEARPTPKTNKMAVYGSSLLNPDALFVIADFARDLETANQVLTEALEEAKGRIESWKSWAELAESKLLNEHEIRLACDSRIDELLGDLKSKSASEERLADIAKESLAAFRITQDPHDYGPDHWSNRAVKALWERTKP